MLIVSIQFVDMNAFPQQALAFIVVGNTEATISSDSVDIKAVSTVSTGRVTNTTVITTSYHHNPYGCALFRSELYNRSG